MTTTDTPPTQIEHLSWSKLQTYSACPKKFFLAYLRRAPAERKSAALVFGGAIHSAIETIHEARISGAPLPSLEMLTAAFDAAWNEQVKDGVPLHYSKGESAGVQRALDFKML